MISAGRPTAMPGRSDWFNLTRTRISPSATTSRSPRPVRTSSPSWGSPSASALPDRAQHHEAVDRRPHQQLLGVGFGVFPGAPRAVAPHLERPYFGSCGRELQLVGLAQLREFGVGGLPQQQVLFGFDLRQELVLVDFEPGQLRARCRRWSARSRPWRVVRPARPASCAPVRPGRGIPPSSRARGSTAPGGRTPRAGRRP